MPNGLQIKGLHIGIDHDRDQFLEGDLGLPASLTRALVASAWSTSTSVGRK